MCGDVYLFCARSWAWGDDMTAFINRFVPDNQNFIVNIESLHEQAIAEAVSNSWANKRMTAANCADYCRLTFADHASKAIRQTEREAIKNFLDSQAVAMPKSSVGWLPEKMRLESPEWWVNQLKKRDSRKDEHAQIKRGKVTKYCSDDLLIETQENKKRLSDWLDRTTLENKETGDVLSLKVIAAKSLSNPKLRVNELAVRTKGMAAYYQLMGWRGLFITITASSSWHKVSDTYNGASPKDTQKMLTGRYALLRAYLSNHEIKMAGMRVAEPHKDGTVHWHLAAWFESGRIAKKAVLAIRQYFLFYEGAPERGALKNRIKFAAMNPAKGDVVGYVLKYISKNVDGAHIDEHTDASGETVTKGADGAARVRAWAACWGIRQFQFIGTVPVNIYRELRRIREVGDMPDSLRTMWACADCGDYLSYILAYTMTTEKPEMIKRTFQDDLKELANFYGDVQSIPDESIQLLPSLNKYLEPKSIVLGVRVGVDELMTRKCTTWTKVTAKKEHTQASAQERVEAFASVRAADGVDGEYWGDVVAFAALSGGFASPSDLWQ